MSDDLTLKLNGAAISGWTDLRVTRGIERCPSTFDIRLTEQSPGATGSVLFDAGDACQVLLGEDLVVTGYIDTIEYSYSGDQHSMHVAGRGKCCDLVDCSAEWPGGQISGTNALDVATKLAAPYGIKVSAPDGAGPAIPQFNLMFGETPYQIIERLCRAAALLCFEDVNGNLVLAQAGDSKHASGVVEGENIQIGRAEYSQAERYSEIDCWLLSMDVLQDAGDGGNLQAKATDSNVKRHRKLYIICDGSIQGIALAQPRANWEMARRFGRGTQIFVTVDSWRDGNGVLWTPNFHVPVKAPNLKSSRSRDWLIAEVSYSRDDEGTRAELHLMPGEAFLPEPIVLQPAPLDLNPSK